jgi:acetyl esterase/lipase
MAQISAPAHTGHFELDCRHATHNIRMIGHCGAIWLSHNKSSFSGGSGMSAGHRSALLGLLLLAPATREPDASRDIVVIPNLPYREGPSRQWRLDLALSKKRAGTPQPAIVVIHGGGWREGDKSSFASDKFAVPGNIVDFAKLGFVAVTINYRLSSDAPFPAALEDCKCAVRWLRAHAKAYNIDPSRIGAYGNSAGGHLALLLGMVGKEAGLEGDYRDQSSIVQAVVSDSGPIDLLYQHQHAQLKQVVSQFLGGPPDGARAALYKKASPICQISSRVPPLLLIYGVEDEQVPIETADQFVIALTRAGVKDVSYHRLAAVGHCPHSLVRVPALPTLVNGFFLRTLSKP